MNNPTLIKTLLAGAAIAAFRIVKFGADDKHVIQAAAIADPMFGATGYVGANAAEDQVDVNLAGPVDIEYGGVVARGDLLTADASGRAIAAVPVAGANNAVIGRALESGVTGDIGSVLLAPGQIHGSWS